VIQSINSDYDSYYSYSTASVSSTAASQTSPSQTEKAAQSSQSVKTDTVEISPQARAAMQQSGSVVSVGGKASAQDSAQQSEEVQSAAVSNSSSSQVDLTSLTETELDRLVSEGTITAAQEQAELARRTAQQQNAQDDGSGQTSIQAYQQQAQSSAPGVLPVGSLMDFVA
jgi:hypothetical protein